MSRTLLLVLALALVASPAVAQGGPPPGYTDPVQYAQDHVEDEAAQATSDPVGYAQGVDPEAEAEHAAWLACWTAYEAADHALDAVCARFFSAPVEVNADVHEAHGEITEVLNETGVGALGDEVLDAVGDTVDDPKSAVEQVQRIARAVVRFVQALVDQVLDVLGLGGLAILAGVLGAAQAILDLVLLPLEGLGLAAAGLGDLGQGVLSVLGLAGTGLAIASSTVADGVLGAAQATLGAVAAAAQATAHGAAAAGGAVADTTGSVVDGVGDAAAAIGHAVESAVDKVGSLFDGGKKARTDERAGLPETPKTGTEADGLLDRLLGSL